tara:strand:+ start:50 stop:922 length:873 start_codon:yes stop_codon:yes gene_type:complete
MKIYSQSQRNYIAEGQNQDQLLAKRVRKAIGLDKRRVESKRHTVISGPPGIGKSYTTMREIKSSGVAHVMIGAGATDAALQIKLAYNVKKYCIDQGKELVLFLDDADDVVFGNKATMNQWKMAMAKQEPVYSRDVNLTTQINSLRKQGKDSIADAIEYFQEEGEVGITVPMDMVRVIILCNKNYEDAKTIHASKRSDVEALIDRVRYSRLEFDWKVAWGWLSYILQNSQPFEDVDVLLDDDQKSMICKWMWDKWENMRNTSYRTIEEMAEYLIDDPEDFEDEWNNFLKVR